jgi:hypothetical protein
MAGLSGALRLRSTSRELCALHVVLGAEFALVATGSGETGREEQ